MDQVWYAARALLAGQDPYQAIGPGRADPLPSPFYYPLTAALLGLPLALLPLRLARIAFVGLGGGLVGYVIAHHRPQLWPLAFAQPFGNAASTGQWSLLLAASLTLPWFGPVLLCAACRTRKSIWP